MKHFFSILLFILLSVMTMYAQVTASHSSPEIYADSVVFRFHAPFATRVCVSGDWQESETEPQLMSKDFDGNWTLTVKGLQPDMYSYCFVVDGVPCYDPANTTPIHTVNATVSSFMIEGTRSTLYAPAENKGRLEYRYYHSFIMASDRRIAIYTPFGYGNDPSQRYPVLYLLHDHSGSEDDWISAGNVCNILDNLIASGRALPMIVVMPNSNPDEQGSRAKNLPPTNVKIEDNIYPVALISSLVNEILPFVESNYQVDARKTARAVAGTGSGGLQALQVAIRYPKQFDFMCSLASGIEQSEHLQDDLLRIKRSGFKLIWQGCGVDDSDTYWKTVGLRDFLDSIGMDNSMYVSKGGNSWKNQRLYFSNFVPILFKYYK